MKKVFYVITLLFIGNFSFSQKSLTLTDSLFNEADSLYKIEKYLASYKHMSFVIFVSDSSYADAFWKKAEILYKMEEYDRSFEEINYAININSNEPEYFILRGNIYNQLFGNYRYALNDFNKAISLDSLNDYAYASRAMIWGECGYDDYLKRELLDYDKAIDINPNAWYHFFNRGHVKENMGDHEGACKDWKKAIDLGFVMKGYCNSCKCE
jgi:tetratricopeptide (TPR) repeat protein